MIHHVQLAAPPASDDAVRHFWADTLGFSEIENPAG
jgi:hypothetical protein